MQPSKLTIHEIFERERRYTVPLFQRAYVWTREDQWEPLWEDIERQARNWLIAEREDRQVTTRHFLGAVVLNVARIFGRGLARCEIIDGQQRLITLQVFLAALRDLARAADDEVADGVSRLTLNPVRDTEERFKVWPTNSDRDVFTTVMTAGSQEELFARLGHANGALPKLAEAYSFFTEAIKTFVYEDVVDPVAEDNNGALQDTSPADRFYSIWNTFRTTLQIVSIELEDGDDPQVIFETLNARGQPLLPSDLTRNTVFLEASTRGLDIDELYEKHWKHFDDKREPKRDRKGEDRFWHLEEKQGRLKRPRIDLFIFHDLTVRTEHELNIGRLFRDFREWYSTAGVTTEQYLDSLKKRSQHFEKIVQPYGADRVSVFARRLRSLDTSTAYPILLFLMSLPQSQLPARSLEEIVTDLESYLIRRFICKLTTKNYNRFFLSLLRRLKRASEQNEDIARVLRNELLRPTESAVVWPSYSTFRECWLNNPIYVKSRIDRSAMILQALNEAMTTSKSEKVELPENLTVEHLLPQKWGDDYPIPGELPLDQGETPDQRRERLINTVGNLTLLTGPLNSSVRNGPFPHKASEIGRYSDLRINAPFRDRSYTRWSEKELLARGAELFETALTIWPHPNDERERGRTAQT
jgi:hypothetical protein